MTTSDLLEIGDVIKADLSWVFAAQSAQTGNFVINQEKDIRDITGFDPTKPRFDKMCEHSNMGEPLKKKVIEAGAILAGKNFVVVQTGLSGGASGRNLKDSWGDGWHVTARALNDDGQYDSKGLTVEFYQTGSFNCMIKDVKPVAKMQMTFVPV